MKEWSASKAFFPALAQEPGFRLANVTNVSIRRV